MERDCIDCKKFRDIWTFGIGLGLVLPCFPVLTAMLSAQISNDLGALKLV